MEPARVFLCESQPIVLEGLKRVLQATSDLEFCGSAESFEQALPQLPELRLDLLLVDQSSASKSILQSLADLRRSGLKIATAVWVSNLDDLERYRLMEAGAAGIVRKQASIQALLECLRTIHDGKLWVDGIASPPSSGVAFRRSDPRLTPRERDIVRLLARGMTNREIAGELSIAQGTVKVHLMHVFEKTGVRDRLELAAFCQKLLDLSSDAPSLAERATAGSN